MHILANMKRIGRNDLETGTNFVQANTFFSKRNEHLTVLLQNVLWYNNKWFKNVDFFLEFIPNIITIAIFYLSSI